MHAYVHVQLFTVAKIWKQLKCPLMDKWIKKMSCTHTHTHIGVLLSHKKNEILLFVIIWLDFEGIILSEKSHKKDKSNINSLKCGI